MALAPSLRHSFAPTSSTMRSLLRIIPLMALTLVACRKETTPLDRDYSMAVDNSRAELYFTDALKMSDAGAKSGAAGVPCAQSVLVDLDAMPRTMLIDLGNDDCTGVDGISRRGRLFVTFTGPYGEPGTVITITPQDYHVNGHLVQGSKTVTNGGTNAQGQTTFSVAVNGSVTAPDGSWTSTHNYQRTRTWIAGEGTPHLLDDVYLITGGGSGVGRAGNAFTVAITTPLRVQLSCPWIVSGVQEITPQGRATRIIDFGNGACDNQVTVSVGEYSITVGGG
jgi:hypothetical protein